MITFLLFISWYLQCNFIFICFLYLYYRRVTEIGVKCGERECNKRKADLGRQLTDSLIEARHSLSDQPSEASELLQTLIIQTIGAVETHVAELQVVMMFNNELH